MWKWNSWKRKLRNKHLGGRDGHDEFRERNLEEKFWEMKFKGEKIWDYKTGETLKRKKGVRKGTIK